MRSAAGHEYLTLKDDGATLDIVRFRGAILADEEPPAIGAMVIARGRIDTYAPRSRYQLVATSIQHAGSRGLFSLELEALKRRLSAEGLFATERKRPLPVAPRRIGLVTSRSGAVIHDVLRVLRQLAPQATVIVVHARVQGAGATEELAAALRHLDQTGRVDVILVARGGGSSDDLSAFNGESLLRAIAEAQVPVISAVGHESDVTLADLVADVRAGTPSIGAALVAPPAGSLRAEIKQGVLRAHAALLAVLRGAHSELATEARALFASSPGLRVEREGERLAQLADDLQSGLRVAVRRARESVAQRRVLLEALSPLGVLERGYAIALGPNGQPLRSWREAQVGAPVTVRLAAGGFRATITATAKGVPNGDTA